MTESLSFVVHGEVEDIEWNPEDWKDCKDLQSFKDQLIDSAEEQSTWGISLVGKSIEELWEEVQKVVEDEE